MDKVVIYGAGNMGRATTELLMNKCDILAIIDRNEKLKGNKIMDIPILTPDKLSHLSNLNEITAVVAMVACPFAEVKNDLESWGLGKVEQAGAYVSKYYSGMTNVWTSNKVERSFCDYFADEESKKDYLIACDWFEGNVDGELRINQIDRNKYFPSFLSGEISRSKVMVDTAVLEGGYVDIFLNQGLGRKAYAYTLTPSSVSREQMENWEKNRNIILFNKEAGAENGVTECRRMGLMRPFTKEESYKVETEKIDKTMKYIRYDYLRCYSMSKVLPILEGACETIQAYRPVIAVNIGHYESDFNDVPKYLKSILEKYLFYFRLHSYQGNDSILYAVPEEKTNC